MQPKEFIEKMNKRSDVKPGTAWSSVDSSKFRVISTYIDDSGNTWVYYRKEGCPECQEYSCWIDSFLSRFRLCANEKC